MQKKLTITLDETVYEGLHNVIGRRNISHFIENLVRPHVVGTDLDAGYRAMAAKTENHPEGTRPRTDSRQFHVKNREQPHLAPGCS